ncbi:MAG: cadherin-like beta sandwich domain-containing protein [Clostridia bacterium]|nr:cadherin-like beta sandwich domain-containing protein [Clostridia bacterium]MDD4386836.1 cadherin-like beta sandwich domain-containing protein [Clostridia bacterium]
MKKLKKISILMVLILTICTLNNVYGISATLSPNVNSILQGNTFTVNVSLSSDVCGAVYNVSYDTSKLELVGGSDLSIAWVEGDNNVSYTFKAKSTVTGSASINLSGTVSDTDFKKSPTSSSKTVTITAPVVVTPVVVTPVVTPTTTTASSDATLKGLRVSEEGLSPNFKSSTLNYSIAIGKNVNNITVTATPNDSKATFYVSGNTGLVDGDNKIYITVTAADKKTKKTYSIVATKSADPDKANAYLENLIIDNSKFSPEFSAEVLEYNSENIKAEVEKLEIRAFPKIKAAKVEITGNDKLVEGENIIKVKVTAVDGTTTKEYTIKVTKEALPVIASTVNIYDETDSLQDNNSSKFREFLNTIGMYLRTYWLVLTLFAFILFEFAQIVYLYLKVEKINKTNNNDNDENTDTMFFRRRNNSTESIDKEQPIDDISDELVDSSSVDGIGDDDTNNFEDTISEEDYNK